MTSAELKKLLVIAKAEKLDVLYGNALKKTDDKVKSLRRNPERTIGVTSGLDLMTRMLNNNHSPVVWLSLFRREFLVEHELCFDPRLKASEDGDFILKVLMLAQRCAYDNILFYQYQTRPQSLTALADSNNTHCAYLTVKNVIAVAQRLRLESYYDVL